MRLLTALLSASLPLASDGQAQLLPAGEFKGRDGRPGPGKTWRINDAQGLKLSAELNRIAALTPIVIDYDHQTLYAATSGQRAPASGWIKSTEWRPGEGLFSKVEWTAAASAAIDAKEYRFISPVITYAEDGTVTGLQMAALTNYPALLGMDAAVAALSALSNPTPLETNDMDLLAALCAILAMPTDTKQEAVLAAVKGLKDKPATPALSAALVAELGLPAGADETAALTAIKTIKTPDTATNALIATLQGQVTALTAEVTGDKVVKLVDDAISAKKIVPAVRDGYINWGRRDLAALTALLESTPVIPGLGGQSTAGAAASADAASAGQMTALSAEVMGRMGLTPEVFAKGATA